ncbi:hypothetical protein ACHAQJ_001661 [Trichoderma viride]
MWSFIQRREIRRRVRAEFGNGPEDSSNFTTENGISVAERYGGKYLVNSGRTRAKKQKSERDGVGTPIVVTSEPEDPLNPQNWPLSSRCKNLAILSFLIFTQGWAGSSESMESSRASSAFHVSKVAENLSTAMYLFGVATGAPFAGPLSETAGRNPTYLLSTFCYLCFVLGTATASTFGGRITCRYFVGLFSSATLAINGSSVRDQFRDVKRSLIFPLIAWVNVVGKDYYPKKRLLQSLLVERF